MSRPEDSLANAAERVIAAARECLIDFDLNQFALSDALEDFDKITQKLRTDFVAKMLHASHVRH